MRRFVAVFVALTLLTPALPLGPLPAAAASELQVSVHAGFDGTVRPGTWIPVDVDLANGGPNVSGDVELSVQRRGTTQNTPTTGASVSYTVPVTVPEHSTKRFSTAVFVPPFFDLLQVRLVSGDQTLWRDSFPLQRVDPTQVSCGVLATDQSAFESLNGLNVGDGQRQPHVVGLDLPDLPTNPQLLGSLDCLILSDYSTRGLSTLQQSALSAWVDNGGILTIGTGPDGASTLAGLPADLLPAKVEGTVALRSLAGLATYFNSSTQQAGPWLAANLKPTDGMVIASDESQPILVVGRRGKGAVFLLSLSLAQPPLRGWDGLDHIWGYILSYIPVQTSVFSSYYRQEFGWGRSPREVLTRGGGGTRPESQLLLLGLLLFGLLIGPINFLFLSRLRRRELALVTVPVMAGLATAGALIYANHYRQGDVIINQVSIVRTWDGTGIGQSHSFVGIFALHPQTYAVAAPDNSLLSSSAAPFQTANTNRTPPPTVRVRQGVAPEVQGLDLQPGILSTLSIDGHVNEPGRIGGTIRLDGDTLTGQIINGLPLTIGDAALVSGDAVLSLGDLRPGASHAVSLRLPSASPIGFVDPGSIVDHLMPGVSHDATTRHDPKYDVLSAALNPSQSYTGQVELGGLSLIGWVSNPLNPVSDPTTGQVAQAQTLFITNLKVDMPGTEQTIPGQLVERHQLTSSYSARIETNGISVNSGDTAAFEYDTPIDPAHFSVRSLTLATAGDLWVQGTLELYNWRALTWETVPFTLGNLAIPTPERYFSSTGTVRLRFHYRSQAPGGQSNATFSRFQLQVAGVGR